MSERDESARERRVRLRRERDGSGPASAESPDGESVGARNWFALLGEVLLVGLLVTVVGLAIISLPAGLAAGIRHLRRFVRAEDSRLTLFWRDVVRALPGGAVVGLVGAILIALFLLDIDLARSGALPGGPVVAVVGWLGLAATATAVLAVTGEWEPDGGWRQALRSLPIVLREDPVGALYLLATGVFVVAVTWALVPLFIPAVGCAALAIMAVPRRPRRTSA
ncbi:hypothetical protein [Microbacterium sp. GXF0217]